MKDIADRKAAPPDALDPAGLLLFATIAEHGSLKGAARALGTVQSNVTQRLRGLEARIGLPLFDRQSTGVRPTQAGQRLLPHAQALRRVMQDARDTLSGEGEPAGPFEIGAMETTAALRLPGLLAAYTQRYPCVDVALRTGPTHWIVEEIAAGRLEGGFVDGPVNRSDIVTRDAFREELCLITRRGAAPPGDGGVPRIVVFRGACAYRARLQAYLDRHGSGHRGLLEFGSLDGLLACVAAGLGISLLPGEVVRRSAFAGDIETHGIGPAGDAMTVFAMRDHAYRSSALQAFIDGL